MNIIPIVFATDNNFVPYCGVAVSSLLENASSDNEYRIYIIYDVLSQHNVYKLENLSTKNIVVKCICIHDYISNLIVTESGHIKIASAYRIFIPEIFSEYDKVLYIDSDVVVCEDVAILYASDIGNSVIGATNAIVSKNDSYYKKVLNISREDYFNAGIILINIEQFRKDKIKERCIELLRERTDFQFMDQCALNIACQGKVSFLDKKWNYEWMYLFGEYDGFEEMSNPSIIHYDSIEKPWTNPGEKWADVFWKCARKTPFYEEILQRSYLSITGEVIRKLGPDCIGKKIAVYGAGYVGKRFVRNVIQMNICDIVLWVDRDYQNKKSNIMKIEDVSEIYNINCDYIFVAIIDNKVANSVKAMLVENGMDEKRIICYSEK